MVTRIDLSHIHHIIPRSQGGTNRHKNLALLHKSCHKKLHDKGLYDKLKKNKQFKESTFMSIIHKRFMKDVNDLKVTYGYRTWVDRNELGLLKSHANDAFVISGGRTQERCREFKIDQKHRHSRVLQLNRKGFKPSIRRKRYEIQYGDVVFYDGKWMRTRGVMNLGKRVYIENKPKTILAKRIEKVFHFGSFCWI